MNSNSLKNNITYKLFTYKSYMYNHLTVSKQMIDVKLNWLVSWLIGFYGISTFVGYLMPNPFLYK